MSKDRASVPAVLVFCRSSIAEILTRSRLIRVRSWVARRLACSFGWTCGGAWVVSTRRFPFSVTAWILAGVPMKRAWWFALRRVVLFITVRRAEGGSESRIWLPARMSPTVSRGCEWLQPGPVIPPARVWLSWWLACGVFSSLWWVRPPRVRSTSGGPACSCGGHARLPAR